MSLCRVCGRGDAEVGCACAFPETQAAEHAGLVRAGGAMSDKLEQVVARCHSLSDWIGLSGESQDAIRTVLAALKEAQERVGKQQDLIVALEALLVAYRLGSSSRADAALTKVEKARAALEPKR